MRTVAIALLVCLTAPCANAGSSADVDIYDRTDGTLLPIYRHQGRLYVAGEPHHRYEIHVRNNTGGRLLAVTSVDGVNVVTGQSAAERQSGYVIGAHEHLEIEGWRKSLQDVATFYFTSLADSYAARTARPDDVGVIGVAFFHERARCCEPRYEELGDAASADAPAAQLQERGASARAETKLGTGHGDRAASAAHSVSFERSSATPAQTIVIYYDSLRNLIARGVVPRRLTPKHGPRPFPNGFVPDP